MKRFLVAIALLVLGCEQDVQDRPGATFSGTFRAPPTGGGSVDTDGGTAPDGGIVTYVVTGRVAEVADLGDAPSEGPGVPDRQVAGYDPAGDLVTTVSGEGGAFELEGLARTSPVILSASGEPPSFVVLETSRLAEAIVPVIDAQLLDDMATVLGTTPSDLTGNVLMWVEDARGEPVTGIVAEVISASPVEGPFYGTTDPLQLTGEPPTSAEALVVILNAVAATLEVSLSRLDTPETTEVVEVPVEIGVTTFYEYTTEL